MGHRGAGRVHRPPGLDRLEVIHGGDSTFPLVDRVRAVPLSRLTLALSPADL
jgi:hypothetical protein